MLRGIQKGESTPSLKARPVLSEQSPVIVPLRLRDLSANLDDPENAPQLLINARGPQHVENDVRALALWRAF